MAPSTQSNSEASPASCPAVRGSPRCLAQRPLPSMTIATCPGTLSAGIGRRPGAATGAGSAGLDLAVVGVRRWLGRRRARSTSGSERSPRSRCHCSSAATSPLPSRRLVPWLASAPVPVAGAAAPPAARWSTGLGIAEPVGRQAGQTMPPAGTEKCRCGPGLAAAGAVRTAPAPSRPPTWRAAGRRRAPAGRVRAARPAPAARRRPAGTAAATAPAPRRSAGRRSPAPRCRRCSGGSRRRASLP